MITSTLTAKPLKQNNAKSQRPIPFQGFSYLFNVKDMIINAEGWKTPPLFEYPNSTAWNAQIEFQGLPKFQGHTDSTFRSLNFLA